MALEVCHKVALNVCLAHPLHTHSQDLEVKVVQWDQWDHAQVGLWAQEDHHQIMVACLVHQPSHCLYHRQLEEDLVGLE